MQRVQDQIEHWMSVVGEAVGSARSRGTNAKNATKIRLLLL